MTTSPRIPRRSALALGMAAIAASPADAADLPPVRLGVLPFGTLQWVAETIRLRRLDAANGCVVTPSLLANTEAAKTALMGGAVDIAISDWPFVAAQRRHGGRLSFIPFSSSLGGVMVQAGSAVRGFADLRAKRLGVAGGGADKSWLVVQAAARKDGIDLAREAVVSYGAPPLLNATFQQGRLDALLTFWNFAARLQVQGATEVITVADCANRLGVPGPVALVGYVFADDWARAHPAALRGFLAATAQAQRVLREKPESWDAVRPLMQARDDREFAALRDRFIAGLAVPSASAMRSQAQRLLQVLASDGLASPDGLPDGVFWQEAG